MRDVWGLIVALTGLFIVWLWATGRAAAAWQSVVSGTATANNSIPASVNLNPYNVGGLSVAQAVAAAANPIQVTPYNLPQIPIYVQTVGSNVMNIPTTPSGGIGPQP